MKGVLSTGFAEVTAAQLYYEVTGAGEPIVLLHSAATDHRVWDAQFEKFAKSYLVIRFDARGFGQSEMPDGPFSHTDDLAQLVDYLELERTWLIGLREGGAAAVDYALRHPDRVAGLVMASPTLGGLAWSPDNHRALERLGEAGAFDAETIVQPLLDDPSFMPPPSLDRARLRLQQILLDNAHMIASRRLASDGVDQLPLPRLETLARPILLLIGERDAEAHHTTCRLMMARIPDASAASILGAGHFVNVEQPEAFNRLVLEFLSRPH